MEWPAGEGWSFMKCSDVKLAIEFYSVRNFILVVLVLSKNTNCEISHAESCDWRGAENFSQREYGEGNSERESLIVILV